MILLFALLLLSRNICNGAEIDTPDSALYDELCLDIFKLDQAFYTWLFTIAPSADSAFTVHQLQTMKVAIDAIITSIEYEVITIPDIGQMFRTQKTSNVINTIAEMMGLGYIDVSELLINDRLAVIPHHKIVHHLSMQNHVFAHFIKLWEEDQKDSAVIKNVLLTSIESGGYGQVNQIQLVLLLSESITCSDAMIEDYLFDLALLQNNSEAMRVLDNYIHPPCAACGRSEVAVICTNCSFSFYCDRECQLRDWRRNDGLQPSHKKICTVLKKIQSIFKRIKVTVNSVVGHIVREFVIWEFRDDAWHGDVVDAIYEIIMNAEMDIMRDTLGILMSAECLTIDSKSIRKVMNELSEIIGLQVPFEEPSMFFEPFASFLSKLRYTGRKDDFEFIDDVIFVADKKNIWWGRWKKLLMQNNTDEQYMDIMNRLAISIGFDDFSYNETAPLICVV